MVFAPVGADGQVSVFVSTGSHVIADVLGWYSTASDAELFKPVKPKRVWDSRQHEIIPAGGELTLKVTDIVGVPSTASAVVLNVTATGGTGTGFLTVYPSGVPRPEASNVNYVSGETVPNVVISGVSVDGRISIYDVRGDAHRRRRGRLVRLTDRDTHLHWMEDGRKGRPPSDAFDQSFV